MRLHGEGDILALSVSCDGIGRNVTQQDDAQCARWSELCGSALACSLTGPFPLLLHQQHTLKGTPLERLYYPWLETPTGYLLHGFRCGLPARPRLPR
jgi:hypothetical protein